MQAFNELARSAQFRRLTPLARLALAAYDMGDARLCALQLVQNATWRVRCRGGGRQFLLRMHAPRWHDAAAIRSELLWLAALGKQRDLRVPAPFPTRSGRLWTEVSLSWIPEPRVCTLLTWVPGRIERRRTPAMLHKIGQLMARPFTEVDS